MIKKYLFATLVVLGYLILPDLTHAYEATKQSVVRLDDNTVLFMVEYEFGFLNAETWLPIGALRSDTARQSSLVSYVYEDAAGVNYDAGQSYAIVLSDAAVVDNKYYYIPQGKRETFTLVTVLRSAPADAALAGTSLQVTSLPFFTQRSNRTQKVVQLVDAEILAGYRTPAVSN